MRFCPGDKVKTHRSGLTGVVCKPTDRNAAGIPIQELPYYAPEKSYGLFGVVLTTQHGRILKQ